MTFGSTKTKAETADKNAVTNKRIIGSLAGCGKAAANNPESLGSTRDGATVTVVFVPIPTFSLAGWPSISIGKWTDYDSKKTYENIMIAPMADDPGRR